MNQDDVRPAESGLMCLITGPFLASMTCLIMIGLGVLTTRSSRSLWRCER